MIVIPRMWSSLSATVFPVLTGRDLLSPGFVEKTPKVAHASPGDRTYVINRLFRLSHEAITRCTVHRQKLLSSLTREGNSAPVKINTMYLG